MSRDCLWMVRAGRGGSEVEEFLEKGIIAIGWEIGDLNQYSDKAEIKDALIREYPNEKEGWYNIVASQISRFRFEIKKGEKVITYNPSERVYHIGVVSSEYKYNDAHWWHYVREVDWQSKVERDSLSISTKNSLGAISTVFKLNEDASRELLGDHEAHAEPPEEEEDILENIKEDIEDRALEFIKDKVAELDWEEMQELVAGLLRSMGYKTLISPKGADRGKDIIASPDGLGLEDPKIIVEVKHRKNTTMGSQDIRSLLGGLRQNDKALYVSTGGFTKDARYEAERSNHPLTLIDLDLLVNMLLQNYDNADSETKALLPLKKLYWPL